MPDFTPNLHLAKPIVDGDDDVWGDLLNDNADILDTIIAGIDDKAGVSSWNGRTGDVSLLDADVIAALGFTPYSASNPAGYITASSLPPPSTMLPLLEGVAAIGTSSAYARADHVHPKFGGDGATLTVSDTPPPITQGAMWFDAVSTQLYIGYVDPTGGGQWVIAVNNPPAGATDFVKLAGDTMTGSLNLTGNSNVVVGNYTVPGDALGNTLFTRGVSMTTGDPVFWNAYWDTNTPNPISKYVNTGYAAGIWVSSGELEFLLGPSGASGSDVTWPATFRLGQDNRLHVGGLTATDTIGAVRDIFSNAAVYGGASSPQRVGIYGDVNGAFIWLDRDNARKLIVQAGDGNLVYYRNDGAWLMQCTNAGEVVARAMTAHGDLRTDTRLYCNDIMNVSGRMYLANNYNYYFGRDSDGYYRWIDNGSEIFALSAGGDSFTKETTYANRVFSRGAVHAGNDFNFFFGPGASGRVFNFAPNWYWDWNSSTGGLYWNTPSGWVISLQPDRTTKFASTVIADGTYICTGLSSGVRYDSGAYSNGHNFCFGWQTVTGGLATISVNSGGAVYALANASDARLKLDVRPSTLDALDIVNKLPLASFDWLNVDTPWELKQARSKADKSRFNPHARIGMVAQEVQKVFPEGVYAGDDFDDHLGRVWGLDQNAMLALLVKAVQQLTARVEAR